MSDRARTPSPHKQTRVEPGIFSSISSFPLHKLGAEGKPVTVKSSLVLPSRPKSPAKPPMTVSPARSKSGLRTPERTRSPVGGRAAATHSADMSQPTPRAGEEIAKLQEKVQKLTTQLVNERKLSTALEQKCWTEAALHKEEQAKLRADLTAVQQNLQKWKTQAQEQAQGELAALRNSVETCKAQIKAVVGVFVGVLEELLVKNFYSDELVLDPVEEERLACLEAIQKQVLARLDSVVATTGANLSAEISGIQTWVPQVTNQASIAYTKGKLAKPAASDDMPFVETEGERAFPQLSYSVEFFTDEQPEAEALHPLNPLRGLEENRGKPTAADSPEGDELKQRIISRIKARESARPVARALYDFVGEMEGDLSFRTGDEIEVIRKEKSGWWVGRCNGAEGSFPRNFVDFNE